MLDFRLVLDNVRSFHELVHRVPLLPFQRFVPLGPSAVQDLRSGCKRLPAGSLRDGKRRRIDMDAYLGDVDLHLGVDQADFLDGGHDLLLEVAQLLVLRAHLAMETLPRNRLGVFVFVRTIGLVADQRVEIEG